MGYTLQGETPSRIANRAAVENHSGRGENSENNVTVPAIEYF